VCLKRVKKQLRQNKLLALYVIIFIAVGSAGKVPPLYWCGKNQVIPAVPIFPVVTAFRSLQLSGRNSFPVVTAFRSLQLSGRYSFPVVPAF
jgi:hypothetical protein